MKSTKTSPWVVDHPRFLSRNNENSRAPRVEPCGTPHMIGNLPD